MSTSPAQDLCGVMLDGRYRLTKLMGEGGMGQVYEGVHDTLDQKVAVKVLLPRFAYDPKFRERFLREAKAASKVRHPNVVQILDFGETPNGSVYFAMEFLEGRDMQALLKAEGPLPWSRARHLLLQITSALGAAHEHKIIHRDIKPANFFVTPARGHQEFVKVLDFGIAKIAAEPGDEDNSLANSLTGTGEIFGTAKYMAPEQAYGSSDDPRIDVYSVGIVAYQMVVGRVPFTGKSAFEIITRHVHDDPRPPREIDPEIPEALEAVILRALAKDPEDRFSSIDEMERALAAIPAGDGTVTEASLTYSGPVPAATDPVATDPTLDGAKVAELVAAADASSAESAPAKASPPPSESSEALTRPEGGADAPPEEPAVAQSPSADATVVVSRAKGGEEPDAAPEEPSESSEEAAEDEPASDEDAAPDESTPGESTSRIASPDDGGGATGPLVSRRRKPPVETSEQVAVPADDDERPASRGWIWGAASVLVGGLVAAGLWGPLSGDDRDDPPKAGPSMVAESTTPPPATKPEPESTPKPEPVMAAGATEGSEPSPEADGSSGEAETEEPEPTTPETSPEPTSKPKAKPKPKPKTLTDEAVRSKVARRVSSECKSVGSGSVSIELLVGSTGKVLSKKAPGLTGTLKDCVFGEVAKAKFPKGETRKVSIDIRL